MSAIYKLHTNRVVDFAAEELLKYLRMMADFPQLPIVFDPKATEGFRLGLLSDFGIPFEGEETEIGFNHKYFHDALKACEEDLAKIEFNSNLSPCIIKPVEGEDFTQMVLPVKLKNEN